MSYKTIDHLSLDAAKARESGMTYGKYMQWKAMNTEQSQEPIKRKAGEGEAICKNCGKIFTRGQHFRVYCSRLCRAGNRQIRDRAKTLRGGLGEFG